MKKILAIFLSVLFVFGTVSMLASAGKITKDDKNIYCNNFLDFSKESTDLWAEFNEETGKWECKITAENYEQPEDPDTGELLGTYIKPYKSFSGMTWSLIENGEVLHFEAGNSVYPGLSFMIDEYHSQAMRIGSETGNIPEAEYVKIRVRNYSTATRFSFGFTTQSTNAFKFMEKTVSELTTDANGKKYISGSGEWETYVFSMRDINAATNYGEFLNKDAEGNPQSAWGGQLGEFLIFPFGYNVTDGTGSYAGAAIDIDYIVIGSKDYVTNYQSELERKEASIDKLELVTTPTKKSYHVGETLDLTGLQLKATYKDGTTEILDSASSTVNLGTAAEKTPVTLRFGSKTVSYDISVIGINSIEVIKTPESTVYELASTKGKKFVPSGYEFKVNYADGTSKEDLPASAFNCSGDFDTVGKKTVTANYYGVTTTFDIDIVNVTDLEITTPEKQFRYGNTLSEKDFNINFVYSDGSKKESGADGTATELTFTVTGETKVPGDVTVTITAVKEDLGINITKEVTIKVEAPTGIEVTSKPIKTEYKVNERFDTAGMVVSLVYADDSKVVMKEEDYNVRLDTNEPGTKTATVRSRIEGLNLTTTLEGITVTGDPINTDPSESTPSTTKPAGDGTSVGLIIGIVAAVVAVVAVVVVVLVVVSKKKKKA